MSKGVCSPCSRARPGHIPKGGQKYGKSEGHWVMNPVTPVPIRCNCWPSEISSSSVCISSASLSDKSYMYDNDRNRTYRSLIIRVNHLGLTLQHQILELVQVNLGYILHLDICLYLLQIPPDF